MAVSISAGRALICPRAAQRSDSRRAASDRLTWDPAGAGAKSSSACQDTAAARDLLVATGMDWDLRVLAARLLQASACLFKSPIHQACSDTALARSMDISVQTRVCCRVGSRCEGVMHTVVPTCGPYLVLLPAPRQAVVR